MQETNIVKRKHTSLYYFTLHFTATTTTTTTTITTTTTCITNSTQIQNIYLHFEFTFLYLTCLSADRMMSHTARYRQALFFKYFYQA